MSTEVTPESLRVHVEWLRDDALARDNTWGALEAMKLLLAKADRLEREQRPLPTVPGWYPTVVVERGGESCTGALLADDDGWRTAREVGGCYGHWTEGNPDLTIRWAEQDGTTPGQTLWEAEPNRGVAWSSVGQTVKALYERSAAAVLSAHGTPTLTPVGEHPEPGTRGLLPVVQESGEWCSRELGMFLCTAGSTASRAILVDPRPDGAQ